MMVLHLMDITERRETEARLAHRALHDLLTACLDGTLLDLDRLEQAVRAVVRGKGGVAVLYLDLDDFKEVNDTYGHAAGDQVLIEVASRLRAAVRPADPRCPPRRRRVRGRGRGLPPPDALALAERRVREALRPPIGDLTVAASVGTAHSNDVGLEADALLHEADADMYRAKRRGSS